MNKTISDRPPLLPWSTETWTRWSQIPRLSTIPVPKSKFLLCKAPVSTAYETKFGGDRNMFSVSMYVQRMIAKKLPVGLVIDCTCFDWDLFQGNSDINNTVTSPRYFHNTNEWEEFDIDYYRLSHNNQNTISSTSNKHTYLPNAELIQTFIQLCTNHWKNYPTLHITVFDSRGSNGIASFLVACYLCEKLKAPVHAALSCVSKASPSSSNINTNDENGNTQNSSIHLLQGGIYDFELVKYLQQRYHGKKIFHFDIGSVPKWWFPPYTNDHEHDDQDVHDKKQSQNSTETSQNNIIIIPPYEDATDGNPTDASTNTSKKRSSSPISLNNPKIPKSNTTIPNPNSIFETYLSPLSPDSQRYNRALTVFKQITNQNDDEFQFYQQQSILDTKDKLSTLLTANQQYKITWKSEGRKGFLLVLTEGNFFLEPSSTTSASPTTDSTPTMSISLIKGPLYFPNPTKPSTTQHRTLLDVTLVLDQENPDSTTSTVTPRFMITDVLVHMGGILLHKPFHLRYKYIVEGIVAIRKKTTTIWNYSSELIKLRANEYFELQQLDYVKENVCKNLPHTVKGIVLVPLEGGYRLVQTINHSKDPNSVLIWEWGEGGISKQDFFDYVSSTLGISL